MQIPLALVRFWHRCGLRVADLHPADLGLFTALAILVSGYAAYFGSVTKFGFGGLLDPVSFAFTALVAWLAGALLVFGLLIIVRKIRPAPLALVISAALLITYNWPAQIVGLVLVLLVAALGASAAASLAARRNSDLQSCALGGVAVAALAGLATLVFALIWSGTESDSLRVLADRLPADQQNLAMNPSEPGPHQVETFTYGPGTDLRRREYGTNVTWKARVVDGSRLLKNPSGWEGDLLKWYWGFDTTRLPLNAKVWAPKGSGAFPLLLIVHGNHRPQEPSDPGYAYLGQLLASRGYIAASVDENFLNDSGQLIKYDRKENLARAWLLLEHLRQWRDWSETAQMPAARKVDWNRIGLIGHSRGGEAVALAAELNRLNRLPNDGRVRLNYNFAIKAVVAIAPVDGGYRPAGQEHTLHDVSYLTLGGSFDSDMTNFVGMQQFQRATYSPGSAGFKASAYIYRANHGQFNSIWGSSDKRPPELWLLNRRALLNGETQRRIAQVYISAFLDAALSGRAEYRALFRDVRTGAHWFAANPVIVTRYGDGSFQSLCNFDEDYDLDSCGKQALLKGHHLSTWREGRVPARTGERLDNGVFLGWKTESAGKARFEVRLTDSFRPEPGAAFEFALANAGGERRLARDVINGATDMTIELGFENGQVLRTALSVLGPVFPPLISRLAKFSIPGYDGLTGEEEPVLQTYRLPVTQPLRSISFVFDRAEQGLIVLDDLGFSTLPPGTTDLNPPKLRQLSTR